MLALKRGHGAHTSVHKAASHVVHDHKQCGADGRSLLIRLRRVLKAKPVASRW